MKKTMSGFTLIEILIVVFIIGIIAGITLVTYNGVQARARNSQTLSAANQWVKILKTYQLRNHRYPELSTCLGSGYGYGVNNDKGSTGVGQCRQTSASSGIITDPNISVAIAKYSSNTPNPAFVTAANSDTDWHRGIYYSISGADALFTFVLDSSGASECPHKFADMSLTSSQRSTRDGNHICTYKLGNADSTFTNPEGL